MSENGADEATVRTLEKGLGILEQVALAGRNGMSVVDLEERLHINRTTLNRFIATLLRRGYLEQVNGSCYRIGIEALSLASASITGLSLHEVGSPLLEGLRRVTHETVHIVILDGSEMVTIDRLEAEHPFALRTHIGARRPAHCTAAGKAVLAYLDEEAVDEILARGMPVLTPRTITDPLVFKAQLQEVRRRGYAVDDEELVTGVRCLAAPVFDLSGRVAGAVSLSAPCIRVSPGDLDRLAVPLMATARRMSRQLGYRASIGRSDG